jgi:hypothetical protein
MKDFYDLRVMARAFEFDGALLVQAIRATFKRRRTALPGDLPTGLSNAFAVDPGKTTQWAAFARKSGASAAADLQTTITAVAAFVEAPLAAAASGSAFRRRWSPGRALGMSSPSAAARGGLARPAAPRAPAPDMIAA